MIAELVIKDFDRGKQMARDDDFESYIDLLECERSEKNYDWQSDIFIPEWPSQVLTEAAGDAEYFKTRDFVTAYVEDNSDEAVNAAAAATECINRTLNRRGLRFYQKFMRAKMINNMLGEVIAKCEWRQKTREAVVDFRKKTVDLPKTDKQLPDKIEVIEPVIGREVVYDYFDFDILDPRNVSMSDEYVYSIQDKRWIIVRFEKTLDELKEDAERMGYTNLDKLEAPEQTDVDRETREDSLPDTYNRPMDIYERFGKFWCRVTKRDEFGEPVEAEPGIDRYGKPYDDAELLETIITVAKGPNPVVIRFKLQPYKDSHGNRYRPLVRGLCYVHPTKDNGLGDGKLGYELQVAINDTFNISQDRVMLSTMPVLTAPESAAEDMSTWYFEPENVITYEGDVPPREIRITDNINGALQQIDFLVGKSQQVKGIYPTSMGQLPSSASTTATAVAGAETNTDRRSQFKSLTFENTFLTDLYWMILQMTYQFAKRETGEKLMGDKIYAFDPTKEYFYKPVSQTIETEYSKQTKINQLIQLIGYIAQVQNSNTAQAVNYMLAKIMSYMGDEFENFAQHLLTPGEPTGGVQAVPGNTPAPSNQYGVPQSSMEMMARGVNQ